MPRRGNNRTSLADRLAHIQSIPILPSDEIPGTKEWRILNELKSLKVKYNPKKSRENFFENSSVEDRKVYNKNIPRKIETNSNNEKFIDNINQWVDGNGWQYIDGGEHNGSWVNSQYPNRIFNGVSSIIPTSEGSETVEFPVAALEDDLLGLACHYEVSNTGTKCKICPNKWTNHDSTYNGRLQAKHNASHVRRLKRYEAFDEAEKIKNPIKRADAILDLKAQFLSDDIVKEHKEWDEEL